MLRLLSHLTGLGRALRWVTRTLAVLLLLLGLLGAAFGHRPHHATSARTHHLAHLAHHLAGIDEAVDEVVDVADLDAGALRDTGATRTVEDRDVGTLCRGHGTNDGFDTVDLPLVNVLDLILHLTDARQHAHDLGHRTHAAHLAHEPEEVVETELPLAGHEFDRLRLFLVESLLSLLDEGEHVTHVEDA